MDISRRYSAFLVTLTAVYLIWIGIQLVASFTLALGQANVADLETFPTSVSTHGWKLHLGWDFACLAVVAALIILGRRLLKRQSSLGAVWAEILGATMGMLVVLGFPYYVALVINGELPSLGLVPMSWSTLCIYTVIVLFVVFAPYSLIHLWQRKHVPVE